MKSKTLNLSLTTPTLRDCRCACRYRGYVGWYMRVAVVR